MLRVLVAVVGVYAQVCCIHGDLHDECRVGEAFSASGCATGRLAQRMARAPVTLPPAAPAMDDTENLARRCARWRGSMGRGLRGGVAAHPRPPRAPRRSP